MLYTYILCSMAEGNVKFDINRVDLPFLLFQGGLFFVYISTNSGIVQ